MNENPNAYPPPASTAAPLPPPPPLPAPEANHVPVQYAGKTGLLVAVFAIVLVVGLGLVFFFGARSRASASRSLEAGVRRAAEQPAPVNVVRVQYAPPDSLLTLPGDARSFYETTIFARTSGYLSKWFVDIGDHVKAGDVLATIETPELDDQVAAAKAKVEELKAGVHVSETATNFAKLSYDRWERAAPEGAVSEQERDQKKSELESSLAHVEAAKAQLLSGQADLQRLLTLVKFKTVTAPYAGTITQRHVDVGALVTAGSTTNTTSLFTLSQAEQIRVYTSVPQAAAPDVKVGMVVGATAREYPGEQFHGKVERTSESIDPVSRTLRVEVLIPNADARLLPGMYLEVTFKTARAHPPLRIPAGALVMRPSGPQAAVVGADGRVTFHPITIGHDLGDSVEVTTGLSADDRVALNIGNGVVDGERVEARVVDEAGAPVPAANPPTASAAPTVPVVERHDGK